MIIYVLTNK